MKQIAILCILLFGVHAMDAQDLKKAVMTDDLNELKLYVKKYGVNVPQKRYYPIVAAAKYGRLNFVKYLIENGADINAREYKKRTALMYAIKNDFIDIALYLLEHQPDIMLTDYKNQSALHIAHTVGNYDKIKAVLSENPFVQVDGPYIFSSKKKYTIITIRKDENGETYKDELVVLKDTGVVYSACYDTLGHLLFEFPIVRKIEVEKKAIFEDVDQIVAISDIEGNYDEYVNLLISAKVMNEKYQWTFGTGHLVLIGDFFDRGSQVTECLWLTYYLEQQALQTNGKVHFLIGNHEEMNLRGDFRYVNFKYIANADFMGKSYSNLYSKKSYLSKWLRKKNGLVKINGNLFVHAGISPEFAKKKYSLEHINRTIRSFVHKSPTLRMENEHAELVFDTKNGPLWYRGLMKDPLEDEQVQKILDTYKAKKLIIGHTAVNEITSFYDQKVINIDVKHLLGSETSRALLIKEGHYYSVGKEYKKRLF